MSILKKLKSLAPALSAVVVAACIGVSLHGYSTPVYAVDIPEKTKNQTDEDASEQESADTAEKEKKVVIRARYAKPPHPFPKKVIAIINRTEKFFSRPRCMPPLRVKSSPTFC